MPSQTHSAIQETIYRIKAGFPVIWLKTEEYLRASVSLQNAIGEENVRLQTLINDIPKNGEVPKGLATWNIFQWDVLNGLVNAQSGKCVLPIERTVPGTPQPLITPAYKHILSWANQHGGPEAVPPNSIVIVNGFHNLLSFTSEVGRIRAALLQIIQPVTREINLTEDKATKEKLIGLREEDSYRTVILVAPQFEHPVLSPDLLSYIETINFVRPSQKEIQDAIEIQLDGREPELLEDKNNVEACSRTLMGSTLFQVENATTLTYVKTSRLDRRELQLQYKAIMELHPALEISQYEESWDNLIGFEEYKEFMTALLDPSRREKRIRGVLFIGAPGGGKSHAAKATGNHFNRKTIACYISRLFNKNVGGTEDNTDAMFNSINGAGDSLIYLDEIEKAFGGMGTGGDTGVGSRLLQAWLTWMNDHPDGPILIATANELGDKLPQEFLREERWDVIFNVPPPSAIQRKGLIELYAGIYHIEKFDMTALVQETKGWMGAEIKGLLNKADLFKTLYKEDSRAIERAKQFVKPLCTADKEKFEQRVKEAAARGVSVNKEENEELIEEAPTAPRSVL